MTTTTMVHVRVNEQIKTQASEALASMGLSVSDAVRALLTRIAVEKQLPFALRVPNAETRAAMAEADEIIAARRVRFTSAADLFRNLEENSGG
jgi:DNA-damage-inducible protein J